jgi:CRISPR/Cas system-associated endonuclease Cas1
MFHVRNDEGERDIPVDKVSSIHLSKASAVSTEALMLAVENEIEVLLIDRKGNPLGRLWSNKYVRWLPYAKTSLPFRIARRLPNGYGASSYGKSIT